MMKHTKQRKVWKIRIAAAFLVLLVGLACAFVIYTGKVYRADTYATKSLKSDELVQVVRDGDITFKPVMNGKRTGFIFYPGAKVEAAAYAPLAKEIAARGFTVVIAKMRFNLAILSPNRADRIIAKNENIKKWAIGGHSLGGVMAADYALGNDNINGLVLLASYPQKKCDLTKTNLKALSLWGSNDKVADLDKVKEARKALPPDAEFTEIKGGNHGGFGDYGHQKGDGEATITNQYQMHYAAECIIRLLEKLDQ